MATMLALLFGDDPGVTFTVSSPTNPGFTRTWSDFSAGIDEVIDAHRRLEAGGLEGKLVLCPA